MKEVFESKKKLFLFATVFYVLTSTILKIIPFKISDVISYVIFPVETFYLTSMYYVRKKVNKEVPIILAILYLLVGYILIANLMSPLKAVITYLGGLIPLIIAKVKSKLDKKELKYEIPEINDLTAKKYISYFLPLIITFALEYYYTITIFNEARIPLNFLSIIVTVILTYSIYCLILSIVRNTSTATKIYGVLLLVVHIINVGRVYYTSDTLLITDVMFLQNAFEVAGFAGNSFVSCLKFLFFPTLFAVIVFYYLFKVAKRNNIKIENTKNLLVKGCLSIIILLVLFIPNEGLNRFTTDVIYDIDDGYDNAITASNTRYFYKYGVLSGLYGKLIEARRYEPSGYNEQELTTMLNNAPTYQGTWKKPNIIVIFSESFWDISRLDNIEFDKDVTPNFHRLKEEGISLDMISPAYGGMSSNVEFEILTGGSLNYFSKGYTPYMQLFNKGKSEKNPSIIQELKNNGYKTKILNSSSANMFNCDKVYDFYGVDERNHLYDEIDLDGNYVTDAYLTDQIIKYFDNKDKDEKTFFFTITMGGHMPYFEERYDNYDVNITKSPYSNEINEVIHSYAEGIYLADKELGRLYDYINTLDEETIVIFFGDHLPHLVTDDGKDALFTTDYLSSDYNLDSVYKQFNTTALILSNYDIDYDGTKYISPDLLMSYVLNNIEGMELSPFYRWLYQTRDVLPSSNYVVSQDKDGKKYYTLGLKDEMKEMYDLRKKVQYMLFK